MEITRRSALILLSASSAFAIDSRETAPKFHAKSMDGEKFDNASVKGKAVLVQFWATWCPYCKRDEPAVDQITTDYADKGLIVLAVDMQEAPRKVTDYLARSPRACKIVLMRDTNLGAIFVARAFPYYVLIDTNGKIAATHRGAAGEDGLRRMLRKAIEMD